MNKSLRVCIDRVLPGKVMQHRPTEMVSGRARAIAPRDKPWMNGSELTVRFMGGTTAQRSKVREQAQWWLDAGVNLTFTFGDRPDAKIRIAFDQTDGAWSYIGKDCQGIPANQSTMNLGFLDGGTTAHEFGHTIGLAHEHQNPEGGLEWNEGVVIKDLSGPPNNWDVDQIRHNVLEKYSVDQIMGTEFDPDSIMLYAFPGTWVKSGKGTTANDVLSNMDKQFVTGASMYPKNAPTHQDAVDLKVNASRRTPGTIGKAGEEDLYTFVVKSGGTHVIDTKGSTDLIMTLFGPDNPTTVIAEDDDSGAGLNPRIATGVTPGRYWVQLRHYSPAAGVGDYTIRVRRPG
jgi:hypothetical protein